MNTFQVSTQGTRYKANTLYIWGNRIKLLCWYNFSSKSDEQRGIKQKEERQE